MKKSFAEEVPAIQAKMPGGYSLENPEICVDGITGTPSISLSFSKCLLASSKSSGMMLEEDYSRLNQLFQEDFQRIKRERGYEVRFVMVWRLG
jgi:hypothetical protein